MPHAAILATGSYVPENVVTNDDMTKRLTTSNEWIQQRTGVKERRYVSEGQGPAELACQASRRCLDEAGLTPDDLDLIILATQTPEHQFPGTACFLQEKLGGFGIPALDLRNQCTGFLYGLSIADAYVRQGVYQSILLVGTEVHSTGLDFSDRSRHITVLFGDGAGAVLIGPAPDDESRIISTHLHADGRLARELWTPAPSSLSSPRISHEMLDEGLHYPRMSGKVVFKEATSHLRNVIKESLEANDLTAEQIDYYIPHQANKRINEATFNAFNIPPEKIDHSIERYGNCAAASVPIAFDEAIKDGRIRKGHLVMFATFAAGFTWGATILRY